MPKDNVIVHDDGGAKLVVIYHAGCLDGFGAAWAVWKRFPKATFIPATYGDVPPELSSDVDVAIVDFSYSFETLARLAERVNKVLVLDHHKTAQAALENLPDADPQRLYAEASGSALDPWGEFVRSDVKLAAWFDARRSGCTLAWQFFHHSIQIPMLLSVMEDRDLWKFRLDDTREIYALVASYSLDFSIWGELAERVWSQRAAVVAEGQAIVRSFDKQVHDAVSSTRRKMVVGGWKVPVANVPFFMASDAGAILSRDQPFAATYYDKHDGTRIFSLRSQNYGVDVSEVAKLYGGGGHKHAAGFKAEKGWEGDLLKGVL